MEAIQARPIGLSHTPSTRHSLLAVAVGIAALSAIGLALSQSRILSRAWSVAGGVGIGVGLTLSIGICVYGRKTAASTETQLEPAAAPVSSAQDRKVVEVIPTEAQPSGGIEQTRAEYERLRPEVAEWLATHIPKTGRVAVFEGLTAEERQAKKEAFWRETGLSHLAWHLALWLNGEKEPELPQDAERIYMQLDQVLDLQAQLLAAELPGYQHDFAQPVEQQLEAVQSYRRGLSADSAHCAIAERLTENINNRARARLKHAVALMSA
jgi:hypothetical protein